MPSSAPPTSAPPTATDVLVVGAGPAGSAAAAWAARAGLDVVLADAATFPRDKPCGDGLTPRAIAELEHLGLGDWVRAHGTNKGLRAAGFGAVLELPWPGGSLPSYGGAVPRLELDARIREVALKDGAVPFDGARAVDVERDGERITGVVFEHGDTTHVVHCRRLVVADGARSPLGRVLGREWHRDTAYGVAARGYIRSGRSDDEWISSHLELRGEDGEVLAGYGWVFPLSDGEVNIGVGTLARPPRTLAYLVAASVAIAATGAYVWTATRRSARTVGRAATTMGVDASTVSRRLVALEATVGATLFDRGRDGITPTEAAEDLMPVAERIEEEMSRFSRAAEGLEREAAGLVRITCPPDVADVVVAPLVRTLLGRHPRLRLVLDPGEAVRDLTRREADLALRTVRPTSGDLVVTRLTTVRWVLVASKRVAKELGSLRSWTDAPWVGWGERLSFIGPARWLAEHVPEADPVVRSDSLMVQLGVVTTDVGVALVPEPTVAHFGLERVKLSPALRAAAEVWPTDELFLVTHRALKDVPRIRAVWDLLVENLRDSGSPPSKSTKSSRSASRSPSHLR